MNKKGSKINISIPRDKQSLKLERVNTDTLVSSPDIDRSTKAIGMHTQYLQNISNNESQLIVNEAAGVLDGKFTSFNLDGILLNKQKSSFNGAQQSQIVNQVLNQHLHQNETPGKQREFDKIEKQKVEEPPMDLKTKNQLQTEKLAEQISSQLGAIQKLEKEKSSKSNASTNQSNRYRNLSFGGNLKDLFQYHENSELKINPKVTVATQENSMISVQNDTNLMEASQILTTVNRESIQSVRKQQETYFPAYQGHNQSQELSPVQNDSISTVQQKQGRNHNKSKTYFYGGHKTTLSLPKLQQNQASYAQKNFNFGQMNIQSSLSNSGFNSVTERREEPTQNFENYLIGIHPSKNSVLQDKFTRMSLPRLPMNNNQSLLNYWSNGYQGKEIYASQHMDINQSKQRNAEMLIYKNKLKNLQKQKQVNKRKTIYSKNEDNLNTASSQLYQNSTYGGEISTIQGLVDSDYVQEQFSNVKNDVIQSYKTKLTKNSLDQLKNNEVSKINNKLNQQIILNNKKINELKDSVRKRNQYRNEQDDQNTSINHQQQELSYKVINDSSLQSEKKDKSRNQRGESYSPMNKFKIDLSMKRLGNQPIYECSTTPQSPLRTKIAEKRLEQNGSPIFKNDNDYNHLNLSQFNIQSSKLLGKTKVRLNSDQKSKGSRQRNEWINSIPSSSRRELTQKKVEMKNKKQLDMIEQMKEDFQRTILLEYQREERIKKRKMRDRLNRNNNSELQKRQELLHRYTQISKMGRPLDYLPKQQQEDDVFSLYAPDYLSINKNHKQQLSSFIGQGGNSPVSLTNKQIFSQHSSRTSKSNILELKVLFSGDFMGLGDQSGGSSKKKFVLSDEKKLEFIQRRQQLLEQMNNTEYQALVQKGFEKSFKILRSKMQKGLIQPQFDKNGKLIVTYQSNKIAIQENEKESKIGPDCQIAVETVESFYSKQNSSESEIENFSRITQSDIPFAKELDRQEALEFDGKDIPKDFLKARLSLTQEPKDRYIQSQRKKRPLKQFRRNTEFKFFEGDIQFPFDDVIEPENHLPSSLEEGLDMMLEEFVLKAQFLQGVKDNDKVSNKQRGEASQLYQKFVKNTLNYGHIPLPVLLKIKKGVLFLPGSYTITEGLGVAINESLKNQEYIKKYPIKRVIFDRNNMNDKVFALVLRGIKSRPELESITSIQNEIGEKASKQICNLLRGINDGNQEEVPNISELFLIRNKCVPQTVELILNSLSKSNTLRKLALQDFIKSETQVNTFLQFLSTANSISDLNISWSNFNSNQLCNLFKILETNRTITNLDLSYIEMSNEKITKFFPKFLIFIQLNTKLMHLNMTQVNLPNSLMVDLIKQLKRSSTLVGVHLCGNTLSDAAKQMLDKKLKPKYLDLQLMKNSKKHKLIYCMNNYLKKNFIEKNQQIYESVKLKDMALEWLSVKKEYMKEPKLDKELFGLDKDEVREGHQPLILQKQLGHQEILNSKHWKVTNECWMCEKWRYTCIFWNVQTGQKYQITDGVLEEMFQDLVYNSNDKFNKAMKINDEEDDGHAYITGSFTNWEPRRMLKIDELCAIILNETKILQDPEERIKFSNEVKGSYRSIMKNSMPYDNPQMINYPDKQMMNNKEPNFSYNRLFVYCDFIKPGKHQYLVSYKSKVIERPPPPIFTEAATSQFDEYGEEIIDYYHKKTDQKQEGPPFIPQISELRMTSYHQFLGSAELEDYNLKIKETRFNAENRVFDKYYTVFKDWRQDNDDRIKRSFLEEISYWKVQNFVKDPTEVQTIIDYLKSRCVYLKTLFIVKSSTSNYPSIRWLSFSDFIHELDIIDHHFEMGAVDRIYIAVTKNMDRELLGIMPEKDMSRFQFYESLVRIAFFKFKQTGIASSTFEGLKLLIDEIITPIFDISSWEDWRKAKLWNLEISDLYKSNKGSMDKLYKYYFVAKKNKTFYLQDAEELIQKANLGLLPEHVQSCWGMSKMTIENDITQRDRYLYMTYVEFLEFFARISEIVFKDSGTLISKIERLMDHMFQILLETKRKKVTIEINYVSESEDELDEYQYYRSQQINEEEIVNTNTNTLESIIKDGKSDDNDNSCHGITEPHQHQDWACVARGVPCSATDPDQIQAREILWESLAKNEQGLVPISEVLEGLRTIIPEKKLQESKSSIMRAFIFTKDATSQNWKRRKDDYIEKDKFRIFLVALKQRFEYWHAFKSIDSGDDHKINYKEFLEAKETIEQWVGKISDPKSEFNKIDKDGGGQIMFDEFCNWSVERNLQQDIFINHNHDL